MDDGIYGADNNDLIVDVDVDNVTEMKGNAS